VEKRPRRGRAASCAAPSRAPRTTPQQRRRDAAARAAAVASAPLEELSSAGTMMEATCGAAAQRRAEWKETARGRRRGDTVAWWLLSRVGCVSLGREVQAATVERAKRTTP